MKAYSSGYFLPDRVVSAKEIFPNICLSGTSNSILRPGLVSGMEAGAPHAYIENHSIGASGTVALGYHLKTIDFTKFDFCVLDYCVNEEVFLFTKQTSIEQTASNVLDLLARATEAGCRCVFVIFPHEKRLTRERPFDDWLKRHVMATGVPIFDIYPLLEAIGRQLDIRPNGLFLDMMHVHREIAVLVGRHVARRIDASFRSGHRLDARDAGPFDRLEYVRADELRGIAAGRAATAQSKLVTADYASIEPGETFTVEWHEGAALCGLCYDQSCGKPIVEATAEGARIRLIDEHQSIARNGKFTLICCPIGDAISFGSAGLNVTVVDERESPVIRGKPFLLSGVTVRPHGPRRQARVLPLSDTPVDWSTDVSEEEIAALAEPLRRAIRRR